MDIPSSIDNAPELLKALIELLSSYRADFMTITGAPLNKTEAVKKAEKAIMHAYDGNKDALKTETNGYFSIDEKKFINLEVSKSSPNRVGYVQYIEPFDKPNEHKLHVQVKFRDFEQGIVAYR